MQRYNHHYHKLPFLFIKLLLLLTFNFLTYADVLTDKKTKITTVTKSILNIKNNIQNNNYRKGKLINELKNIELNIGDLSKNIDERSKTIKNEEKTIYKLRNEYVMLENKLNKQISLLQKQAKLIYLLKQQSAIKVVLNNENPATTNRYMYYFTIILHQRLKLIANIKKTRTDLIALNQKYKNDILNLSTINKKQIEEKNTFQQEEEKRNIVLKKTKIFIKNSKQQLNDLYINKKELTAMLDKLEKNKTPKYKENIKFSDLHGLLHWPINERKISQTFNQSLFGGRLHTNGIVIDGPSGEDVHTVYQGKVVFANWVNGFGLLVIIQHDKKYLTLYGHNQSIYVKPGDTVTSGAKIATVGNSGGFKNSGLYFEIRAYTQPLNPIAWLAKK